MVQAELVKVARACVGLARLNMQEDMNKEVQYM